MKAQLYTFGQCMQNISKASISYMYIYISLVPRLITPGFYVACSTKGVLPDFCTASDLKAWGDKPGNKATSTL